MVGSGKRHAINQEKWGDCVKNTLGMEGFGDVGCVDVRGGYCLGVALF